MTYVNNYYII